MIVFVDRNLNILPIKLQYTHIRIWILGLVHHILTSKDRFETDALKMSGTTISFILSDQIRV